MEDNKPKEKQGEAAMQTTVEPLKSKDEAKNESSIELGDLKKRIDRSEREMKAMSEAMKTTLIDVRSMLQEFDNPFTLLKNMGVDKLVNKAVEEVESGVNKAKRDEAMKRMVNPGETREDQPISHPIEIKETLPPAKDNGLSTRMDILEDVMKELVETLDTTLDDIKTQADPKSRRIESPITSQDNYNRDQKYSFSDGNYTAYIQLVSEYLALRFGRRGAERLLLNEVTKDQASPQVVKDVLDSLSVRASKDDEDQVGPGSFSLSLHNADLDDRIMITMLLKNLDKPLAEWGSTAILYLLTVLVKRSTEGKMTRD